jgi:hypothetical protein
MHFIPIPVQDLKKTLLCVPVHYQHANPGAKQHRLDQIWCDTFEFALGDCILEVIDRQNFFRLLLVEQIRRFAEPRLTSVEFPPSRRRAVEARGPLTES